MDDTLLLQALAADVRFTAAVASGSNSELLALLNADDPKAPPVLRTVTADEVKAALGAELLALDAVAMAQLTLVLAGGSIDLTNPKLLDQFKQVLFSRDVDGVLANLTRPARVCEAFGFAQVTLEDCWRILPQIPASHHARYLADAFVNPDDRIAGTAKKAEETAAALVLAIAAAEADPSPAKQAEAALALKVAAVAEAAHEQALAVKGG